MLFERISDFLFIVIFQLFMFAFGICLIFIVMKTLKFHLQKNKHAGNNLEKLMY